MRKFDACALCLQRARDPVACQEGHLFCKECAYTDLRECRDCHTIALTFVNLFSDTEEGYKAAEGAIRSP